MTMVVKTVMMMMMVVVVMMKVVMMMVVVMAMTVLHKHKRFDITKRPHLLLRTA